MIVLKTGYEKTDEIAELQGEDVYDIRTLLYEGFVHEYNKVNGIAYIGVKFSLLSDEGKLFALIIPLVDDNNDSDVYDIFDKFYIDGKITVVNVCNPYILASPITKIRRSANKFYIEGMNCVSGRYKLVKFNITLDHAMILSLYIDSLTAKYPTIPTDDKVMAIYTANYNMLSNVLCVTYSPEHEEYVSIDKIFIADSKHATIAYKVMAKDMKFLINPSNNKYDYIIILRNMTVSSRTINRLYKKSGLISDIELADYCRDLQKKKVIYKMLMYALRFKYSTSYTASAKEYREKIYDIVIDSVDSENNVTYGVIEFGSRIINSAVKSFYDFDTMLVNKVYKK